MIRGRCVVALVLCAGAALSFASDVAAQSKDEAAARARFDEARQLRESGQHALACPKLEEARRLFTSAGLLFNLADCYEKVGRSSEARATFDEAARVATESGRSDLASDAARRRDSIKPSEPPRSQAQPSAPPAEAPSGDELAARALFEQGRALRDAGRTEDACQKFEASSKRFASAGVVFNLGDCYARLGRTASAWTALRDAASIARQAKRLDIASEASARLSDLDPKLMRLAIHVPHATLGLIVRRDTINVMRVAWDAAIPVDPGLHEIHAEASGYEPWTTSVSVSAPGETVSVEVPALRPSPAPPATAPLAESTPTPSLPATHEGPATRETPSEAPGVERGWLDADLGGAYADVTLFNASTLSVQRTGRVGPTFSVGAGIRLDPLTLGVRVRDLDLSTYNVWEIGGEGALHTRFDRVDAHIGFRGGYALLTGVSGVKGLNVGAFFGFDYYASRLLSLGLDFCPEVLWLQGASQASLGFGFEGVGRLGLHF
jgi:tetratricopeptide (TPR) repeat protein